MPSQDAANVDRTDAREAEGSGLLSRPASDGRAGSNPAPSVGFDDCARDEAGVAPGGAKQASTGARASLPASPSGGSGQSAATQHDNDALWLAYEFQAFRERVRGELDGLVKWANENSESSHGFISNAWAKQVAMWAMSQAAKLDEYEEKLNA